MDKRYKILVVDDMKNFREMVCNILIDNGFLAEPVGSGEEAIERLKDRSFNIVFLDLDMPGMDGLKTLEIIKRNYSEVYVIILTVTAYADPETIVKAMKSGADDFVVKAEEEELVFRINNAIERIDLKYQNILLREEIKREYDFSNIIGESKATKEVFRLIEKVAPTDSTVLIQGESGTGKELVARAIHYNSPRKEKNFVTINCAAIPETLLESELFGIENRVATGVSERKGRFEQAHMGTIFLDEVGDMSLALQAKLLRVLQEKEFERIGGRKLIKIDVKVIAAINKDLKKAVEEKKFREDLYYRLNVFPIYLQPLRERKEDIPLLLNYFLQKYNQKIKKNISKISKEAMDLLTQYDYPGNIRELENLIERAVILTEGETIPLEALPTDLSNRRKLDTSTKSRVLDSDVLPLLSEMLSFYDAPSYIKIPNPEVQKRVFLKTFILEKGTLEDVKDKLGISHGAVHEHFRLVRETIFIWLCRHHGNIENLAKSLGVSSSDLQVAISKKDRLLKFVEGIFKDCEQDEEKASSRFNVTRDEFKQAFNRLKEISK